ncbi:MULTISPECIES: MerR family transcriptional regulator [unclassified Gordonia (in: high G+C Gram-positive bacteria)]|uniref:MerR family transcriptional regulator n=1 Tax=unclassified Gordonia (in: high G+C Gram-positive bacteria) TaxID=2657482 RepID=UPI001F0F6545|nr:MerR family transcriptional regulator [Gordonia sp. ABSL49_1]MCH5643863.1 MerR family transcriptional regulator [Gordonia sp. ABSL49_1]
MFTIGDFATMGRVSIRMLRHYDQIGLLQPARVDDHTGYRYYEADQLRRLNRVVALKDLGFTLAEVARIIDADVDPAELRGMLRLRRAQVAEQIAADRDRLTRIEARLRIIEREGTMSTSSVVMKSVAPVRVLTLTDVSASSDPEDVGPVIRGLFGRMFEILGPAGIAPAGEAIATYVPDGEGLTVTAACPVADGVSVDGLESVTLPGVERAACHLHVGRMVDIGEGYQTLATWIEDNGYRTDGTAREVYLATHPEPEENWRTELQMPIVG